MVYEELVALVVQSSLGGQFNGHPRTRSHLQLLGYRHTYSEQVSLSEYEEQVISVTAHFWFTPSTYVRV